MEISGNISSPVGKLKTGTGAFPITSCLSFEGVRVPETLEILIKLSVDIEIRKTRIVELLDDDRVPGKNNSKTFLVFRGKYEGTGTCYTFKATTVGVRRGILDVEYECYFSFMNP